MHTVYISLEWPESFVGGGSVFFNGSQGVNFWREKVTNENSLLTAGMVSLSLDFARKLLY